MHRLVSLPVLLADPQTVDFAFERHAFADTDREGLGHLTAGKITRFIGNPNYSCYVVEGQDAKGQEVEGQDAVEGQKAAGALVRYRICWVSQPLMRIADVDRLK